MTMASFRPLTLISGEKVATNASNKAVCVPLSIAALAA